MWQRDRLQMSRLEGPRGIQETVTICDKGVEEDKKGDITQFC